jgi:hypothetical protein
MLASQEGLCSMGLDNYRTVPYKSVDLIYVKVKVKVKLSLYIP